MDTAFQLYLELLWQVVVNGKDTDPGLRLTALRAACEPFLRGPFVDGVATVYRVGHRRWEV